MLKEKKKKKLQLDSKLLSQEVILCVIYKLLPQEITIHLHTYKNKDKKKKISLQLTIMAPGKRGNKMVRGKEEVQQDEVQEINQDLFLTGTGSK